ncbi:DUF72 domain-containing protein [Photobacterium sp. TY1-4]|uniref:DUF72 domain-containing protein n=1 Tax=Photobacterium sp. TY1-4 TaxID=2899122 RepID=UPI0021BFB4C7|nr:DUF72 domain-containing protein [Photobacterium sp. TY1-4]UXI02142.1 DUF72 domain-containing protein [Photobacterium sp. TY1-4]
MPAASARPLRLGLAMWSHSHWQHSLYGAGCKSGERLARYAEIFDTVEGNTTFYATPAITTVRKWAAATPEGFRFTFKLPSAVTHQHQLSHCDQLLADFFSVMEPVAHKVGIWKIQLPASFGPAALPALEKFLRRLPARFTCGVEVRHPAFFAKGEDEQALNRLLIAHQANRIIMDSRPVFAAPPTSEAVIDAHQKKPQVPVHAIATADQPVIRFIGHPDDLSNDPFFANWLARLPLWLREGKQPYLFIHTPDNNQAPELAVRLYAQLRQQMAQQIALPDIALPPSADSAQFQLL